MPGLVRVGTSGWVYPHWAGHFYPPGLGKATAARLRFYATRFDTVEVNATFYALVTPTACDRWRAQVGPAFTFAIKGSRYITHMRRLRDPRAPLSNFFAQGLLRLGGQMGPILWQLPPTLAFERDAVVPFFDLLPRTIDGAERRARGHDARLTGRACLTAADGRGARLHHALEPRHPSWFRDDALRFLEEQGVALVAADTAGVHPASTIRTADFSYVRLHGEQELYVSRYSDASLRSWKRRLQTWTRDGSVAFVYFDNDNHANAAKDAARLRACIEGQPAEDWTRPADAHLLPRPDRFRSAPARPRTGVFSRP